MNKDSNKYIYLYSIALVVIVATVLSVAATLLKPFQQKNIEVEKKQSILLSVHKAAEAGSAKNKAQYVEAEYEKYITGSCVVSVLGAALEGDAFAVSLEEEMAKPVVDRRLPVFICTDDDSTLKYIIPVRGAGLWGPIWGYVALHSDFSTICGVVFDHQGETPGLGAELATPEFQRQFDGKHIFDAGAVFTSVKVVKGGGTQGRPHEVDAISGGTITSQGIEQMLWDNLNYYRSFFEQQEQQRRRLARQRQEEEEASAAAQQAVAAARRIPRPVAAPLPTADTAADHTAAPAARAADSVPKAEAKRENATSDATQQNVQQEAPQDVQQIEQQ